MDEQGGQVPLMQGRHPMSFIAAALSEMIRRTRTVHVLLGRGSLALAIVSIVMLLPIERLFSRAQH
jgi:hypothetical protein